MNEKWNPRLWLRDWLNKPTEREPAAACSAAAGFSARVSAACEMKFSACPGPFVVEGRGVALKLLSDRFELNESPGTP